jgi:hypothetical protein
MAKIKYGPMIARASGKQGGTVFSHNRFGPYVRTWAKPVKSTTSFALGSKARLTAISQAWASRTAGERLAWQNWAAANPFTDVLGDSQTLDGHQAYVQINGRLAAAGLAQLTTPPLGGAPPSLTALSATFDVGAGTTVLTTAVTPLAANHRLWIQCAKTSRTSINYVVNLLKFAGVSAAAQATGFDYQALVEARIGALSAGEKLFLYVSVFDGATGLLSPPMRVEGTIVST